MYVLHDSRYVHVQNPVVSPASAGETSELQKNLPACLFKPCGSATVLLLKLVFQNISVSKIEGSSIEGGA